MNKFFYMLLKISVIVIAFFNTQSFSMDINSEKLLVLPEYLESITKEEKKLDDNTIYKDIKFLKKIEPNFISSWEKVLDGNAIHFSEQEKQIGVKDKFIPIKILEPKSLFLVHTLTQEKLFEILKDKKSLKEFFSTGIILSTSLVHGSRKEIFVGGEDRKMGLVVSCDIENLRVVYPSDIESPNIKNYCGEDAERKYFNYMSKIRVILTYLCKILYIKPEKLYNMNETYAKRLKEIISANDDLLDPRYESLLLAAEILDDLSNRVKEIKESAQTDAIFLTPEDLIEIQNEKDYSEVVLRRSVNVRAVGIYFRNTQKIDSDMISELYHLANNQNLPFMIFKED